ncbi:unnamed protein product [Schistocephalus solidus]|uniref:G protein-coupled receptor n=2 Tax=Schistocephalus solidus TaxID=70667 RepID=A0A183T0B0_SCHSO|nr:unnamed protein product [Schistocephalus solidus]
MTERRNQWYKIQDLQLRSTPKVLFLVACSVIGLAGLLTNLPIIITNILHRFRHNTMSDYYSRPLVDRRDGSQLVRASVMARRSTLVTEDDRGNSYFSAVSLQAKYKYSHVVLALSVFNFLSSIILIPNMAILLCWNVNADFSNYVVSLTMIWNVFQIMFVFIFQFINTTIQCLSICFPLHFSLRRSPLFTAFFLIIALCMATSISELLLMEKDLSGDARGNKVAKPSSESEHVKWAMAIVIQIPFAVYCLTALLTLVMYSLIMRSIHSSQSFVKRVSIPSIPSSDSRGSGSLMRQSLLRFWNSVLRQNIQSFITLATSTTALYLLEFPYMLVFCSACEPHYCVLICHLAVHTVQPVLHITLSKAFREVFRELFVKADRGSISSLDAIMVDQPTAGG